MARRVVFEIPKTEHSQMRHFALAITFSVVASLFAAAAMPLVNNSSINYSTNPNQLTVNGSGFSPQGRAPTALFNNGNLAIVSGHADRSQPAQQYPACEF
jgi:hypothetical protein